MSKPITLEHAPDGHIHVVYRERLVEFTAEHRLGGQTYVVRIPIFRLKELVGRIIAQEGEAEKKQKGTIILPPKD